MISQSGGAWGRDLDEATKNGSINFIKATDSAFRMFGAIEEGQLTKGLNFGNDTIKYLASANEYFKKASNLIKNIKDVDDWIRKKALDDTPLALKFNIPPGLPGWVEVVNVARGQGAIGLIEMNIESIRILNENVNIIIKELKNNHRPSNEHLWKSLYTWNNEIVKGIIISIIFYKPEKSHPVDINSIHGKKMERF